MIRLSPLLLLSMLALAGCGSRSSPDLYVLRAPDDLTFATCKTPHTALVIDRPSTRDEYDSKRIPVMLGKNHLSYYSGASWASPFPDQLRDFLIDAYTQSDMFSSVDEQDDSDTSSYSLLITIHEATVTQLDAPVVKLRLSGTLRQSESGRVISRFNIKESVPAAENNMAEIVDAYDEAAANAAQKIMRKRHCR